MSEQNYGDDHTVTDAIAKVIGGVLLIGVLWVLPAWICVQVIIYIGRAIVQP